LAQIPDTAGHQMAINVVVLFWDTVYKLQSDAISFHYQTSCSYISSDFMALQTTFSSSSKSCILL